MCALVLQSSTPSLGQHKCFYFFLPSVRVASILMSYMHKNLSSLLPCVLAYIVRNENGCQKRYPLCKSTHLGPTMEYADKNCSVVLFSSSSPRSSVCRRFPGRRPAQCPFKKMHSVMQHPEWVPFIDAKSILNCL